MPSDYNTDDALGPSDFEEERLREVHRLREWLKYIDTKLRESEQPPMIRKSNTRSRITRAIIGEDVPDEWDELKS